MQRSVDTYAIFIGFFLKITIGKVTYNFIFMGNLPYQTTKKESIIEVRQAKQTNLDEIIEYPTYLFKCS